VVLKELAKAHNIPVQEFVVRNDSPCGSTIGPMLSAKLGLRTVGKYFDASKCLGIPSFLTLHYLQMLATLN
jgi:hypothetical protein